VKVVNDEKVRRGLAAAKKQKNTMSKSLREEPEMKTKMGGVSYEKEMGRNKSGKPED
jgi:hypothetical protein